MEDERKDKGLVIKFTNIDAEDFTHTYDGFPWTIRTGEFQFFPASHARLFAKHLAQKILMKRKKLGIEARMDGVNLFKGEDMESLKSKILGNLVSLSSETKTPQEVYRERITEINRELKGDVVPVATEDSLMTKAQIIVKLQEKGERIDVRKSKDELLGQLKGLK